jgi:hypothetical protein
LQAVCCKRDPLLLSPKLSRAAAQNRASRATIAFLGSDRSDGPHAGDPYGDIPIAREGNLDLAGGAFPGERPKRLCLA